MRDPQFGGARPRRRARGDAIAMTSQRAERCIAGITLRVAIAAHPSTPQRTGGRTVHDASRRAA